MILETEAKSLERMGEMISHLSEDYTKISSKYLQLLEKVEQLEKRLEIATNVLKEYAEDGWYDADQALIEMEGVK